MKSFLTQSGFECFGLCSYLMKLFIINVFCAGVQSHFLPFIPCVSVQCTARGIRGFRGDVREYKKQGNMKS